MKTKRDWRIEEKGRATLSSARRAMHLNAEMLVGNKRRRDEDIAPYPLWDWTRFKAAVVFAAVMLLLGFCARAQNYSIDWHTIDGGGGTSTGGLYSISGTIGQPDAGTMSGGNFSLAGGFWGIIDVIQIPGGPLLTIRRTQTNTVMISWPSSSTGFSLQQAIDLTPPAWNAPSENIFDNGTNKFIIVNPPQAQRYYRLIHP